MAGAQPDRQGSAGPVQHIEIAQRPCIVQCIVRHAAVGGRAEARCVDEFQLQAEIDARHPSRPRHQQRAKMRQILRPIRDNHRVGIAGQISGDEIGRLDAIQFMIDARRHVAQIRNDVPRHPRFDHFGQRQRNIAFLVAMFGHQRDADQRAAETVKFRVEKIAHGGEICLCRFGGMSGG